VADVLVIGGGLAGAAAAIGLARAGVAVSLWEREREPAHKICGEFLSWEAQTYLQTLGIDADALGAVRIDRVRLVTARRSIEAGLGFTARSLTRRLLDAALLDLATAAGVEVRRGVVARAVLADGTVAGSHGEVRPRTLMIATGKHGLRGIPREAAGTLNHQLGFKAYLRLAPTQRAALDRHVELHLYAGGYAGLQLVEHEVANLCFLVSPERWKRLGGDFAALLADLGAEVPLLGERLAGSVALLERPLAIAGVPYGYLHRPADTETVWRLGDQAAVIPSFTGDGMSLALHTARLATAAWLAGDAPAAYLRRLGRDAGGVVARATRLQRMSADARNLDRATALLALVPGALRLGARATRLGPAAIGRALAG